MVRMSKHNGLSIVEVCLVLIASLLFIYITTYVLHLTRVFGEAREVANEFRSFRQYIEMDNNAGIATVEGYNIKDNGNGYYLIVEDGGKISRIDEVFIVCTFMKDSCGYITGDKMKYMSIIHPDVSLKELGFDESSSGTIRVALLFRV